MKISIVYFSGSGSTRLMAQAVQRGISEVPGVEAILHPIEGSHIVGGRYEHDELFEQLEEADAIIFGTPTYMGNVSAQFKAFADATSGKVWMRQGWKDKVAGGFTVGGSPSGDQLSTLQYLNLFAAQHSMNWVNGGILPSQGGLNRLGTLLGVNGQNVSAPGTVPTLHPADMKTAEAYGRRIAEVTLRNRAHALN